MTKTTRRYALLPLCLVSVTALGACGAPSSGTADSSDSDTVAASSPTGSSSTSASGSSTSSTSGSPSSSTSGSASSSGSTVTVTSPSGSTSSSGGPATVTVTASPSSTATLTTTPGGGDSPSGTATASGTGTTGSGSTSTVPAAKLGSCVSKGLTAYTMNLTGVTGAAKQTAQTVYHAARVCDSGTLLKVATNDKTRLGYTGTSPKSAFSIPQQGARYDTLLQVMGLQPVQASVNGEQTSIWPRVVGQPKDSAAWDEVVKLNLITRAQAQRMQAKGNYTGPQVWVGSDGTWKAYTE